MSPVSINTQVLASIRVRFSVSVSVTVRVRVGPELTTASNRLQIRGLESQTAGLQSLRLASRPKPWLRTTDGLGWLMAASHGLQVQTRKLTAAN